MASPPWHRTPVPWDEAWTSVRNASESAFTIQRATPVDEHVATEAFASVRGRATVDEAALREFLRDSSRYLLLAIASGKAVGRLIGYGLRRPDRPEPQFLLYGIDVDGGWRNRGVGEALVNGFIAEARASGAFEVWTLTSQSNAAAMSMYARCGLRRENPDDVMLNLSLNSPAEMTQ